MSDWMYNWQDIRKLTGVTTLSAGDAIDVASGAAGETQRASLTQLLGFMQDNLEFTGAVETLQNASPTTGQTVTVAITDARNRWVAIAPAGTIAALTVAITGVPVNGQEVLLTSSNIITALTVTAAQTIAGQPTTLAVNGFARMKYDGINAIWRRVG